MIKYLVEKSTKISSFIETIVHDMVRLMRFAFAVICMFTIWNGM